MNVVFYHNPRCSKSRAVLARLEEKAIPFTTVEYLETPPDENQLHAILDALDAPPRELLRTGDGDFKALKLNIDDIDREQVVDLLLQHPKWFQRPVVMVDGQARIGRPPENIEALFT